MTEQVISESPARECCVMEEVRQQTYHSPGGLSSVFCLFASEQVSLRGESSTSNTLSMSASKNEFKAL